MKSIVFSIFVAFALTLQAHAYLDAEDGALNVRHFHMVKRGDNGEIVGRAFGNTYDIIDDLERRSCTTILACGTAGGCASMAGQRYCKGESWNKSFQKAVKQTGANGMAALKGMAEGIGRGPAGMIAGLAKTAVKGIVKSKKEKKGGHKKRSFNGEGNDIILGRSDIYEFIERDEDMNLVQRGELMLSEYIARDSDGGLVVERCEGMNGDISCI